MKKTIGKLALKSETVRTLGASALGGIRGGAGIITDTDPTSGDGGNGGTITFGSVCCSTITLIICPPGPVLTRGGNCA